ASRQRRSRAAARTQARANAEPARDTAGPADAELKRHRLERAGALVEAHRQAKAADRYVRRNPWTSVLLAAAAGLAAAAVTRRGTDTGTGKR
ncbi:hypothetical protein G3N58_00815, partial [Paraburkholderia sp. Ac-20342]|nr:hypothetical protein [Paraburkholderia sp. Ac-20342]